MKYLGSIKKCLFYTLLCLIPIFAAAAWHAKNRAYPIYDAAEFFSVTQAAYFEFVNSGYVAALKSLYFFRSSRPVIFPVFGFPAIVASHGSVLPAVAGTMLTLFAFFQCYSFLFFKLWLRPSQAAIATLFLGFTPFIFQSAFIYQAELPYLLAIVGSAYHVARSRFFRSYGHSAMAGIFIALGLCSRPVEFLLCMLVPFLIYVHHGNSEIKSSTQVDAKRAGFFKGLLIATGTAGTLFIFWILPSFKMLQEWIYQCTFGPAIRIEYAPVRNLQYVRYIAANIGSHQIAVMALGVLLCQWIFHARLRILFKFHWLALSIAPLFLASFLSYASSPRYFLGAGLILMTSSLLIVLTLGNVTEKTKFAILAIPLFFNIFYEAELIANTYPISKNAIQRTIGWHDSLLLWRKGMIQTVDSALLLYERVSSEISSKNGKRIGVVRMSGSAGSAVVEPWILNLIKNEQGGDLRFISTADLNFSFTDSQRYDQLKKDFDFILIGSITDKPNVYPASIYAEKIIQKCLQNQCAGFGYSEIDRFQILDEFKNKGSYLLLGFGN